MSRYNVTETTQSNLLATQSNMGLGRSPRRCTVQQFNELIKCVICNGYMIDPTAVEQCYHTYCRSCILKHLLRDAFCPQCKHAGGKPISEAQLKSDDILRAFIYKVVPGLYQRVSDERLAHHEAHSSEFDEAAEAAQEFFSPAEPISLSLEYHPLLLKQCNDKQIPPVRYLQCPASVTIHHLKRFLCTKYDIDPANKLIAIEVIYEDEVLPNHFSLMDVGYCYNWQRHAPMAFCYRFLLYDSEASNEESKQAKVSQEIELSREASAKLSANQNQAVAAAALIRDGTNTNSSSTLTTTTVTNTSESNLQTKTVKFAEDDENVKAAKSPKDKEMDKDKEKVDDVKGIIVRKTHESKKSSGKRVVFEESNALAAKSDFKSLRSNDVRCSPCGVGGGVNNNNTTTTTAAAAAANAGKCKPKYACDIVVSIPQSQLSSASFAADETFELKTANKKSTNLAKNLPKLKIELNSMRTQLMTMSKPKSAGARLEAFGGVGVGVDGKRRQPTGEEAQTPTPPPTPEIDLKTYAKNIGLKPIETLTLTHESGDATDKSKHSSPSASPMSSCSSTSNGSFCLPTTALEATNASSSTSTSSSHKKRKKKHSKDLKDPSGKRKKLHAEISSQTDGKMKMKITATHKSHKPEVKRSHSVSGGESFVANAAAAAAAELQSVVLHKLKLEEAAAAAAECESLKSLNKTLGEEALSINNLMSLQEKVPKKEDGELLGGKSNLSPTATATPKPLEIVRELKNISSPPLPPSLFKTAPLPFTTIQGATTVSSSSATQAPSNHKPNNTPAKPQPTTTTLEKSIVATTRYPTTTSPAVSNTSSAKFAVPNSPRYAEHSMQRYLSTPTSIASAANKHAGLQMKRSLSLDESQPQRAHMPKQPRVEQERYGIAAQRKSQQVAKCQKPSANNAQTYTALYAHTHSHAHTHAGRSFGSEALKSRTLQVSPPGMAANPSISIAQTPISTGAVTITPRPRVSMAQQPHNFPFHYGSAPAAPYNNNNNNKPALEIVRITPNKLPAEKQQQQPVNQPNANQQRLMGPPIGQLKVKKAQAQAQAQSKPKPSQPGAQPTIVTSPPLPLPVSANYANNAYRATLPALINLRNTIPFPFPSKSNTNTSAGSGTSTSAGELHSKKSATVAAGCKANGTASLDRSKTSLRDFRPTSKDGSVDILDLSAGRNAVVAAPSKPDVSSTKNADLATTSALSAIAAKKSLMLTPSSATTSTSTSTSSSSSSSPTLSASSNSSEAALNKIKQNISTTSSSSSAAVSNVETGTDDLQNLQMLSESATARIKTTTNIFEPKLKPAQSTMVRQQNASVRSIPNPSALFNRNQTTTLPTTTATTTATTAAATTKSITSPVSSSIQTQATSEKSKSPNVVKSAASPNIGLTLTTTSLPNSNNSTSMATSPRAAKKLTTIDQVAATLNIRAAAAEASAARAAIGEGSALVTSTSSSADTLNPSTSPTVSSTESSDAAAAAAQTTKRASGAANLDASSNAKEANAESLIAKPTQHVNIAATESLTTVASSA